MKNLYVLNLDRPIDYQEGLKLQELALNLKKQCSDDILIVLEHKPVFTIGSTAKDVDPEDLFKTTIAEIEKRNIPIHNTERGGHITYHGPGQILAYPIFSVNSRELGDFIKNLESVMISSAEEYKVKLERKKTEEIDPRDGKKKKLRGVWYNEKYKVGAIGLKLQDGINTHGFAFNVNIDLSNFQLIDPCGLKGYESNTLANILGKELPIDQVKDTVIDKFSSIFKYDNYFICRNLEQLTSYTNLQTRGVPSV